MNQQELVNFWNWCFEHTTLRSEPCDESVHYYMGNRYVGGWAGDERSFFINEGEVPNKMVAMYEVWRDYEC